ncbi:hypothetical protein FKM82_001913 [Ascaphus truei]
MYILQTYKSQAATHTFKVCHPVSIDSLDEVFYSNPTEESLNMEKTNGEDVSPNTEKKEKRMSYSVETPYGFHLDLDFLKYVHDIEKGNTIKRIHINRKAKQSKFSTLPRNFSVPDNVAQSHASSSSKTWGAMGYKADAKDSNVFSESESSLRLRYVHELNYRRKDNIFETHKSMGELSQEEFTSYRGRPQFARASSMPAALPESTMSPDPNQYLILPQSINSFSESKFASLEEPFGRRHTSSEDHITAALKRIKELEEQLKTIPELNQTISVLKGENTQLTAQLKSVSQLLADKKEKEAAELNILESEPKSEAVAIGNGESVIHGPLSCANLNPSTFLAIKQQVTDLEEQLEDSKRELVSVKLLVERQNNDTKLKDVRIAELTSISSEMEEILNRRSTEAVEYKDIAVNTDQLQSTDKKGTCDKSMYVNLSVETQSVGCGDQAINLEETLGEECAVLSLYDLDKTGSGPVTNVTLGIEPDGSQNVDWSELKIEEPLSSDVTVDHIGEGPLETHGTQTQICESKACSNEGETGEVEHCPTADRAPTEASIGHYVKRIQELLQEQWTYLETGYPDLASAIKQPASKLSSIQHQLVNSLNLLSSVYSTQTASDKEKVQTGSQQSEGSPSTSLKSIMKKKTSNYRSGGSGAKKNLQFVGVNGGYETTSSEDSSSSEEYCANKKTDISTVIHSQAASDEQTENVMSDPGIKEEESQQAAGSTASESQENLQRYTVGDVFRSECQLLSSHLAELRTTTDHQLRQTFYTVCQEWFRVSSQKSSSPDPVAVYLEEFRSISPQLLQMVVNIADENGNTALHYSVSHSNFGIVKLLLETGLCDVDHQNKAGYTPVMLTPLALAETDEDMEVVLALLNHGNVNICATQGGQTALMLAVSHGRSDMVNVLLNCGSAVNLQDEDGNSALMIACQLGNVEIIKLLLAQPECDTELTDKVGNCAVSIVADSAPSEIAELLQAHTEHGRAPASADMGK